ncbi:peptidoglycan-binding protein [Microcoleus sp. FACHB-1515]|uniref:peptidoglycan-binding domain-containing protein n=1 Tax=Cyanophyceae TaxID=3028117 RepID=UPI001686687C|nr:peptidoglycan-binding domain-containing protein [Microcoleus sp. FACHB-1515]MBD2091566.1 peptidoglycan-binding protein [Microcoleus sp. FACHB-1515]
MLLKPLFSLLLTVSSFGIPIFVSQSATATAPPEAPLLIATAYTEQTLPTLARGSRGEAVRKLQGILQSNGYLGAASVRLGNPRLNTVDGIFGAVTESAIRDLQQRYDLPVTGVVTPATWEVLDLRENPYGAPLPWLIP